MCNECSPGDGTKKGHKCILKTQDDALKYIEKAKEEYQKIATKFSGKAASTRHAAELKATAQKTYGFTPHGALPQYSNLTNSFIDQLHLFLSCVYQNLYYMYLQCVKVDTASGTGAANKFIIEILHDVMKYPPSCIEEFQKGERAFLHGQSCNSFMAGFLIVQQKDMEHQAGVCELFMHNNFNISDDLVLAYVNCVKLQNYCFFELSQMHTSSRFLDLYEFCAAQAYVHGMKTIYAPRNARAKTRETVYWHNFRFVVPQKNKLFFTLTGKGPGYLTLQTAEHKNKEGKNEVKRHTTFNFIAGMY